jgi:4-amino-4-deoxy-L-arabinose transferase-like glycosyltransferase
MTYSLREFENNWQEKPARVFLLALFINSVALLLSHNYLDGDPHSRTIMALNWLKAPFFIYLPNDVTWVFAPLHCYLNAAVMLLSPDPILAPRLLSLLLTSLTIFPLYHSVKFEFGPRAALYSALACCFCTLFIHPAAIAASEGINLFFVFSAFYFFLRYRKSESWRDLLCSAFSGLAATMMRYDSGPLTSMMTLLLIVYAFRDRGDSVHSGRGKAFAQALVFGLVSHAFALMWVTAQWIELGHPFYMTVDSLDAAVIKMHLANRGWLEMILYQTAFLPGVMLLSTPLPAFAASAVGLFRSVKQRHFSNLFWLLMAMVVYYLITFVFTLARYPLARFVTLPTVLFLCFSGVGASYLIDRLSPSVRHLLLPIAIGLMVATPVILAFFSHPSENAIAEKLRAISPLTNPPEYYFQTLAECEALLSSGNRLVLDTHNYNQRLLYLDLYEYTDSIDYDWPSQDSLLAFIQARKPLYIVRADYPKTDDTVFDARCGSDSTKAGMLLYRLRFRSGVYAVYEHDPVAD